MGKVCWEKCGVSIVDMDCRESWDRFCSWDSKCCSNFDELSYIVIYDAINSIVWLWISTTFSCSLGQNHLSDGGATNFWKWFTLLKCSVSSCLVYLLPDFLPHETDPPSVFLYKIIRYLFDKLSFHEILLQGETKPFKPFTHRYHTPFKASDSTAPFWYSIKRASAYIIVLSSYSAYGMQQHAWSSFFL